MNKIIERPTYLDRLWSKRFNGRIKIITGLRRCGKSFLLMELFKKRLLKSGVPNASIISVSLDSDENYALRNPLLLGKYVRDKIVRSKKPHYLFIDEIQMCDTVSNPAVPNGRPLTFYDTLNGLLHIGSLDIYVTGSNSRMLSNDVLTEFRGRGDEIRLHPVSFKEYLSFAGGDAAKSLLTYLKFGGMPGLAACSEDTEKQQYLLSLFRETYLKDIVERNRVERQDILEGAVDMLCSSVGSLTNPNRLVKAMQAAGMETNSHTVSKYLEHLMDAFLFTEHKRYDISGRNYLSYPSKFYCEDLGLRNARLGFRQQENTHLIENLVCNELVARGFQIDIGMVESYEKNRSGNSAKRSREIDFVVQKPDERVYIQVAYAIPDQEKMDQELKPFSLVGDGFRRILVRGDAGLPWYNELGVLNISLADFLLEDKWV